MTHLTRSTTLDVDGNRYKLSAVYEPSAKSTENFSKIIDQILFNERENKESCKILAEKLMKIAKRKARMTLELKAKLRKTYDLKLGNKNAEDELRRILANASVAYAPILDPEFVLKTLGNVLNRQYAAVENGRRKLEDLKSQLKEETTTINQKRAAAPADEEKRIIKREVEGVDWKTAEEKGEKSGKILLEELIKIEKEWLKDLDAQLGYVRHHVLKTYPILGQSMSHNLL
uniref:Uncharacterized protein n=1 Tax=Romanomermis culicivorax TaxID=13658 RepID=A0A915JNM9_ROMCU